MFFRGCLTLWLTLFVSARVLCVRTDIFFSDVVRRCMGALRLVLIAPLNCWRNFILFLCKASFCMMKIDHFRARARNCCCTSYLIQKKQFFPVNGDYYLSQEIIFAKRNYFQPKEIISCNKK